MMASPETLDKRETPVREEKWDCRALPENRYGSAYFYSINIQH
jgi:hypothetical protein